MDSSAIHNHVAYLDLGHQQHSVVVAVVVVDLDHLVVEHLDSLLQVIHLLQVQRPAEHCSHIFQLVLTVNKLDNLVEYNSSNV